MPRKHTVRLKTRARLLAADDDTSLQKPLSQTPSHAPLAASFKNDLRILYEKSSLTVREIADAAGLTQRMIYKYAADGRWANRETRVPSHARLDPALAKQIAARARRNASRARKLAQEELTRVRAHRRARAARYASDRAVRVQERLTAALSELSSLMMRDDMLPRVVPLVARMQRLILLQMRRA